MGRVYSKCHDLHADINASFRTYYITIYAVKNIRGLELRNEIQFLTTIHVLSELLHLGFSVC
jgi:hypothetical protein